MCHKCYRNFLINLRSLLKCGICGHTQKIEFHHIKPTSMNGQGRGLWRRAKDIREHPDCYIPLCYFCHQKVTQDITMIIWNPISEYLGWTTKDILKYGWIESDLAKINVLR